MLSLTRKSGQAIFVADSLILTISQIKSSQVNVHLFTYHDNLIRSEELVSQDEQNEIRERILEANYLQKKRS